ncbi:uncharacterized protein JCM6883_001994 [Sporobolomyces salmoneus]|uniref:uncharacterized protein n=1 Tax=Sporobolomyces salmoneus TaxID=183962 RepID=UPI003177E3A2
MAFFVWLQYLTVTFNQFVNPVGLEAGGWRYYFLFWCILVVLLVIIVLAFPETKGRTLEEVALIFDGENALGDAAPVEPELEKSSSPAKSNVEHVEDLEKKGSA